MGGAGWGVLLMGAPAGHEQSHSTSWAVPPGDQVSKFPVRLASRHSHRGSRPWTAFAFHTPKPRLLPLGVR